MLKGLLPDSAIVGIGKRVVRGSKRRGRKHYRTHKPAQDVQDLVNGFAEFARVLKSLSK